MTIEFFGGGSAFRQTVEFRGENASSQLHSAQNTFCAAVATMDPFSLIPRRGCLLIVIDSTDCPAAIAAGACR